MTSQMVLDFRVQAETHAGRQLDILIRVGHRTNSTPNSSRRSKSRIWFDKL